MKMFEMTPAVAEMNPKAKPGVPKMTVRQLKSRKMTTAAGRTNAKCYR